MWPLATLAASLRTDTSPPDKGGFFIGTPHSPSALALRSRPPHSPLGAALRARPPHSPSALALRARLAKPTIPPFWRAPPHSPLGAALRPRPPHSPSALALNSYRFSAGTCPPRPDITAAHCCHLGGLPPASPRHYRCALLHGGSMRGLPRPRTPAAYGFRFGAPSPSSALPPAE